jgi:hypothetical protein
MEAWRQWLLGGKKKKLVQPSQTRIDLTPTGLLMEGHYTQNARIPPGTITFQETQAPVKFIVPQPWAAHFCPEWEPNRCTGSALLI